MDTALVRYRQRLCDRLAAVIREPQGMASRGDDQPYAAFDKAERWGLYAALRLLDAMATEDDAITASIDAHAGHGR